MPPTPISKMTEKTFQISLPSSPHQLTMGNRLNKKTFLNHHIQKKTTATNYQDNSSDTIQIVSGFKNNNKNNNHNNENNENERSNDQTYTSQEMKRCDVGDVHGRLNGWIILSHERRKNFMLEIYFLFELPDIMILLISPNLRAVKNLM